jgi:hypothetical protein
MSNTEKNTVLLIEPRNINEVEILLANTYFYLKDSWNYVFYCGKSYYSHWKNKLPNCIEIRPLEHDNFYDTRYYSDFCKTKELWDSLYGDFILTIQVDAWIMNIHPYTIDFFTNLNKSYIGGNMDYIWPYFNKIQMYQPCRNFNGGLSLRKRKDIIRVIEEYPPLKTTDDQTDFLQEHEDVYFTMGCIQLGLPIGDDENSSHFSLHSRYHDSFFGIHNPNSITSNEIKKKYPYLEILNPYLRI